MKELIRMWRQVLKRSETMFEKTEGKKTAKAGELMHWFSGLRDLNVRRLGVWGDYQLDEIGRQ